MVGSRGYFAFDPSYTPTQRTTMLGALRGVDPEHSVYDCDGKKWREKSISVPFAKSWWRVLLANTVYNPMVSVTVEWHEPSAYTIEELKEAYTKAVDHDDDILTQFVEPEALRARIRDARTFEKLVAVYQWMETDDSPRQNA